jgi:hypothetical protein
VRDDFFPGTPHYVSHCKGKTIMDNRSAQVATICESIDHCFAFFTWCEDFATFLDPDDMVAGLDRGADLVSDATRLMSFLALRKVDDSLRGTKPKPDDLIAADLGIDASSVLGDVGEAFLTTDERGRINKGAAHLTEHLTLDRESEVDLEKILTRSMPVLKRLLSKLRSVDTAKEATSWLDKTDELIRHAQTR